MTNPTDTGRQAELLAETSRIAWRELQYFFAAGKAIHVSGELDLIRVAEEIANDNKQQVEQWMSEQLVMPVATEVAKEWYEKNVVVWAVVVKPWVLVQETAGKTVN